MSYQIPTTEPSQVIAGDTIQFKIALPDYPANDGWVLTFRLVGIAGVPIAWASTPDGADHLFTIPSTTSANYTAGTYQATKYISKASPAERYTLDTQTIIIKANPAAITSATDTRGHVKKVLDAIEAVIEGRASTDMQQTTIDGTQLIKMPVTDLLKLRSLYIGFYRQELAVEKIASGLGSGIGKIRVRL